MHTLPAVANTPIRCWNRSKRDKGLGKGVSRPDLAYVRDLTSLAGASLTWAV